MREPSAQPQSHVEQNCAFENIISIPHLFTEWNISSLVSGMLQVLAYTQKARESYNEEQISLCERMLEYKKHVHHESMLSLNGPYGSPCRDGPVHPFSRISDKVADAVTESAENGKVFKDIMMLHTFTSFYIVFIYESYLLISPSALHLGSNHSTRISFKTVLKFEG